MSEHALLSASSAHRWIVCPGSVALCKDLPDKTSKFSEEGTLAHELASAFLLKQGFTHLNCDDEMIQEVSKYAQTVQDYTGAGTLLVEKRVDYSSYIGVENSFGTSDAIIISEDGAELTVVDLKYGKGVQVDAEENPQLMLYALGAINEFSALGDFKRVRMVIHQPRLNHISEWDCSIEHLLEFAAKATLSATWAEQIYKGWAPNHALAPGKEQCKFCRAKSICPALTAKVTNAIGSEFDDLTISAPAIGIATDPASLAEKMAAIPLIEDWCRSIRAEVERQLLQGTKVNGFKIVRGKAGNRKWSDADEVEKMLKGMRVKQEDMYDFSLISPTIAEKRFKENLRQWGKLEVMITKSEGKLSVAAEDDKRPAVDVSSVSESFDNLNNEGVE